MPGIVLDAEKRATNGTESTGEGTTRKQHLMASFAQCYQEENGS